MDIESHQLAPRVPNRLGCLRLDASTRSAWWYSCRNRLSRLQHWVSQRCCGGGLVARAVRPVGLAGVASA